MERSLKFFADGRVAELEGDQPIKLFDTQEEINALFQIIEFSRATTYKLAAADEAFPEVGIAQRRSSQQINPTGIQLLTSFEGCELTAYQDSVGVWTIGYGHTKDVHPGMKITQAEAEKFLKQDLATFEDAVADAVEVEINADQFSALVSFAYNLGAGSLFEPTLLRVLNKGDFQAAANEFPKWNKAGGQALLGLTRRRLAERALFLSRAWQPFREYDQLELTDPKMQGAFVKHVQERLIQTGSSLQATGIFDNSTQKALQQFQQKHQLVVDGIVGVETVKALC